MSIKIKLETIKKLGLITEERLHGTRLIKYTKAWCSILATSDTQVYVKYVDQELNKIVKKWVPKEIVVRL